MSRCSPRTTINSQLSNVLKITSASNDTLQFAPRAELAFILFYFQCQIFLMFPQGRTLILVKNVCKFFERNIQAQRNNNTDLRYVRGYCERKLCVMHQNHLEIYGAIYMKKSN
jgi:hypothetical protein